ncbi:MAG: hypothetical protein QOE92_529 [Chloroflexota bacterium]|jgi:cytochrome P450|nr:hypothetical protein [Chloroflexota bacterium]
MVALSEIPGPRGLPVLGILPDLARDPVGACLAFAREYGTVVRLPVLWGKVYLLTHPDQVEHVLIRANDNHWKGRLFLRTDFLFGSGLVLNDGDSWHRQRRLVQPAFDHDRIRMLVPILAGVVENRAESWERACDDGRPVEMETQMMTLTLDLICHAMFSLSLDEGELDRLARSFGTVLDHLGIRMATFALPGWSPIPGQAKATRALREIEDTVARVIADHRNRPGEQDDLLTMLLEARDEAGLPMSDRQLRDEVITILFGGYEATAHSLAWAWYLLDRHPEVDQRLCDEVSAANGLEEVARLPFVRSVIDETLRLYPPFWEVLRSSHEEDEIGGYRIPAGTSILLAPYVTHRLPEFWDDPEEFRPQRFEPEQLRGRPRYAYFPFGAGPRSCIGRPLALLEMQLVLALLRRRFRPRLARPGSVEVRAKATLRSSNGMHMRLERAT